ncbi:hypothetical protein FHU38_002806 [Saccharomonospora amisosensis]|uniref:Uncharacterized protein n=1 Tax=Saccharomonospora amisosensis TaxID=1128677 RepID=A0A7X5ZR50_9PSEU|nr:hypothetical protein [Saccharomonospora amisosensis]NIJ12462.1 hypothetical protein [Saccharomonospora amisosensis]
MLALVTVLLTATVVVAPPAAAAPDIRPRQAFTLTITAPTDAFLGSTVVGGTLSGQLGTVTVTATGGPGWTATVSATDFTTGGATAPETIPNNVVRYWSGRATATTGPGAFLPGQPTANQAVTLDAPRTAFRRTGSNAASSASWNPTLVVTVPGDAVAGLYSGVVTHSIA